MKNDIKKFLYGLDAIARVVGYGALVVITGSVIVNSGEGNGQASAVSKPLGEANREIDSLPPEAFTLLTDEAYVSHDASEKLINYYFDKNSEVALANTLAVTSGWPSLINTASAINNIEVALGCTTPELKKIKNDVALKLGAKGDYYRAPNGLGTCSRHKARMGKGWLAFYEAGLGEPISKYSPLKVGNE